MASTDATTVAKSSRSMFDIDDKDDKTETSDASPAKRQKTEVLEGEDHKSKSRQCNASPTFDDDDFDDLDFFSVESQISQNSSKKDDEELTDDQKARAEKNRQKAIALKTARLVPRPNGDNGPRECFLTGETLSSQTASSQPTEKKTIDTGAGFFIEEEDEDEDAR